jgi:norsolorinic acid ketoreductase
VLTEVSVTLPSHPLQISIRPNSASLEKGIGKGLVTKYLLRANHTIIAAVRDPLHSTSESLSLLPVGKGSNLITIPFDASSESSVFTAIATLQTEYSITSISIVIANAGMAKFYGTALQTPIQGARDHYNTNTVGTLALFQAVYPLLLPSADGVLPKFITVSTAVASIGDMEQWPMNAVAYGTSKAALNWLTKNIHIDNKGIIAFPIHPG